MELFKSLTDKTKLYEVPFKHFELNEPLTNEAIKEICEADVLDPKKENLNYDGTRALDGGEGTFRLGIKDGGKAVASFLLTFMTSGELVEIVIEFTSKNFRNSTASKFNICCRKLTNDPCPQPAKQIHNPFLVFIEHEACVSKCKGHGMLNSSLSIGMSRLVANSTLTQSTPSLII